MRLCCWEVSRRHSLEAIGLRFEAHVVVLGQQDCAGLAGLQVSLHCMQLPVGPVQALGCCLQPEPDDPSVAAWIFVSIASM